MGAPASGHLKRALVVFYLATVGLFLGSVWQFYSPSMGFTRLVRFGSQFFAKSLPAVRAAPHWVEEHSAGYDGQFYAQLAVDPLLRDRALDVAIDTPAYRARRILFAWTAYAMGLGQPARILKAYALQNIIAWLALAALLARWLPPSRPCHALCWFACLFSAGLIDSVVRALLEGPSLVLLALGVLAIESRRPLVAGGILGLAGLGRESNVLGGGIVVDRVPATLRALVPLFVRLALIALPAVAWSLDVRSVYPAFSYSNPDSFSFPFAGYVTKWMVTMGELRTEGWDAWACSSFLALVSLTVQAGFLLWRRDWSSPWWRLGIAYCCFLPFLSALVWEGYPGAAPRVLLPMTVAFNVLVPRSRWCWAWAVLGNVSAFWGLAELKTPVFTMLYERW